MIVVDTNVISELMRGEPHAAVLGWVARQPRALLYTTYVNQAEILYGIDALPEGRRRAALAAAAAAVFAEDFAGQSCRSRGGRPRAIPRSWWRDVRRGNRSISSTR